MARNERSDWQPSKSTFPPFRPYRSEGPWSATVVRLAETLASGEDCRLLLSDALKESGHVDLATHFRDRRCHGDACWALRHILGEP